MAEYFELTFFDSDLANSSNNFKTISDVFNSLLTYDFIKQYCEKDSFSTEQIHYSLYERNDWAEYEIAIPNLKFNKLQFDTLVGIFNDYINICMDNIGSIDFVTGIYELTYYITENIERIEDFNSEIFEKFPIVFFRNNSKNERYIKTVYCKTHNTLCCVNENAQNLE